MNTTPGTAPAAAADDTDIDLPVTDMTGTEPARRRRLSPRPTPKPAPVVESTAVEAPTGDPGPQKKPGVGKRILNHLRAAIVACKVTGLQPVSYQEAWRRSGLVDMRRVPDQSDFLAMLWMLSNNCDRVLWFAVYWIAPAGLAGGVLYVAERPTRRWGTALMVLLLLVLIPAMLA